MDENTPEEIARGLVYDRVRVAYARMRAKSTGGWVLTDGQVEVWACPFVDLFNGLISPAWPEEAVESFWWRAVSLYKRTGQDMYVSFGPGSYPRSLETIVRQAGFRGASEVPFMCLDVDDLNEFPRMEGLRIERIDSFSFFDKHEHPWLGPVNTPYRAMKLKFLRQYGEGDSPCLWQFVALSHRRLVGAATIFCCGNEAAIFDVMVDEPHRKRGIGTRLVADACRFARELGIRSVGLGASGEAIGLYQKVGFRRAGVYRDYVLGERELAILPV